jgi:hypothetical protein
MAPASKSAGYSGTPLVAKLGIKAGARALFVNPPPDFATTLGEIPNGVRQVSRGDLDFSIVFVKQANELQKKFALLRDRLVPNGTLWVSWPKKASGVVTDLNENVVREIGLRAGLVDVKVCAIDETWSGLKFVWRLRDR